MQTQWVLESKEERNDPLVLRREFGRKPLQNTPSWRDSKSMAVITAGLTALYP